MKTCKFGQEVKPFMKHIPLFTAAASIFAGLFGTAYASVLESYTTDLPVDHYVAPTSTKGSVLTEQGTLRGKYVSPFDNTTSKFVAVEAHGVATYDLTGDAVSFVFGTPDAYNKISFLNGNGVFDTFTTTGTPLLRSNDYYVTIRADGEFSSVQFSSTSNALEFSNVLVSNVPLPASAPMFGAALMVLGAAGYGVKRRRAAAA